MTKKTKLIAIVSSAFAAVAALGIGLGVGLNPPVQQPTSVVIAQGVLTTSAESEPTLTINNSVASLSGTSYQNAGMTVLVIPASVKTIAPNTFLSNSGLRTVRLTKELFKTIVKDAVEFTNEGFTLKSKSLINTRLNEIFDEQALLFVDFEDPSIVLLNRSTTIQLPNLNATPKEFTVPATPLAIEGTAYQNQGYTSLIIPAGITSIAPEVFIGNPDLAYITMTSTLFIALTDEAKAAKLDGQIDEEAEENYWVARFGPQFLRIINSDQSGLDKVFFVRNPASTTNTSEHS